MAQILRQSLYRRNFRQSIRERVMTQKNRKATGQRQDELAKAAHPRSGPQQPNRIWASRALPGLALVLGSMLALSACDKKDSAFPVPKVPPPPAEQSDKGITYPGAGTPEKGSDAARVDAQGNGSNITGKDPDLGVRPQTPPSGTGEATPAAGTGAADSAGPRSPAGGSAPSDGAAPGGMSSGSTVPDGSTHSASPGGSNQ